MTGWCACSRSFETPCCAWFLRMTVVGAVRSLLRANRLDVVAVGINQERRIIGRAVVGPRAGAAIVAAAGLDAVRVEFLDRRVIGRAERDVGARWGRPLVRIKPERVSSRELNTNPSGASAAV